MTSLSKKVKISASVLTAFILFFIILASEKIAKYGIPLPVGSRHILLLTALILVILFQPNAGISRRYLTGLLIFIIYLILDFIFKDVRGISFSISFITTTFFAFIFLFSYSISISQRTFDSILTMTVVVIFVALIPALYGVMENGTALRWNYGLFRGSGPMTSILVLSIILLLSKFIRNGRRVTLKLAYFLSVIVLLTTIKKALLSLFIVWFLFYWFSDKNLLKIPKKRYIFIVVILSVPFAYEELAHGFLNNIYYFQNVGAENHVRLAMYYFGFDLFQENFPFGRGLGTFGSLGSLIGDVNSKGILYEFSEVYYQYNLTNIGPNSVENLNSGGKNTFFDTFWPHIIAELGFVGSLLYLYLWSFPFFRASVGCYSRLQDNNSVSLRFFIVATFLVVSWEGLTLATPEMPVIIFFHSFLVGLSLSRLRSNLIGTGSV